MQTYSEVIQFLFSQYPIYQNKGVKAYKPDLSNIIKLCEIVGNPQKDIKTIHVAGTNGKGSVCNFLANIYIKSGYKVGLFTSPHLIDFRERITINHQFIEKSFIEDFYAKFHKEFKKISPSFFEWNTVLAFKYFKDKRTEINIIETGLGGRLDSTNIINPELSIITTIGKDHQNILGNTLHDIATEKAGIIKHGTPTLLGADIKETKYLIEQIALEKNSKIFQAKQGGDQDISLPKYQLNNWETALKATEILGKELTVKPITDSASKYLTIKGRWQVLSTRPKIIADIGHNEQGMRAISKQIKNEDFEKLFLLIGFSEDKNLESILKDLPVAYDYYITKSSNQRSLSPKIIQPLIGDNCICIDSYAEAYKTILSSMKEKDMLLITGSAFLVGDILNDFY